MRQLYTLLITFLIFQFSQAQTGTGWNWGAISGLASNSPGRKVIDVVSDASGNVYATGRFMGTMSIGGFSINTSGDGTSAGNYDEDAFIAKWDANGTIQWLKRYGTAAIASNQIGQVVATDASGNVYVGIGNGYPVVIKYDASGNLLWTKTLTQFEIEAINVGPDGNPIVITSNAGAKDIFKLDNGTGNILWTVANTGIGSNSTTTYKDFVDQSGNIYYTAFIGGAGNIAIAGQNYSPTRLTSYIISLDNSGALRWVQPIDNVQVQLGYTIDNTGHSYIQISGGFGGSFQGVSTASFGGKRYLELDNAGTLVRSAVQSPYQGAFRVKDDGIYGFYLEVGGVARTVVFGNNYFSVPTNSTVGLGIVIKYDKIDDHVIWANNFEIDGASYNPGKFTCIDIGAASKVIVGGSFGTAFKFGAGTLTTTIGAGSNQTDFFVAQFDGSNVQPSPTTTWTGTADNSWSNAANWTNGAPIGAENSILPAGAPRYPTGITNVNRTGKLTIANGVSISLPMDFSSPGGIVNSGMIEVTGTGTFQGFNTSQIAPLSGNGRLLFTANSPTGILYDLITNGLEFNKAGGTLQSYGGVIGGGLYLTNGILLASNPVTLTDPNAIVTYSPTAYVAGTLKWAVNASGTYVFPMANSYSYSGGPTTYTPVTITTNSLAGPQYISVSMPGFSQSAGSSPNINLGGGNTITTILDSKNYWNISTNTPITGGTYSATIQTGYYTNGVTNASRYILINRLSDNSTWNFDGTHGTSTQVGGTVNGSTVSNGNLTVTASGLTKTGTFAIGIASASVAAGTTVSSSTWTGAASNSWNNAGNWSNGIPNGLVNAIIPSGLSTYPQTYLASDNARSIQVDAGTTFKLPYNFTLNSSIINNGTIELINGTSSTFFYGFGTSNTNLTPLSGTGKLLFTNSSPGIFQGTFTQSIDVNRTASLYAQSVNIDGNLNVMSGNLYTSYFGNGTYINLINAANTVNAAATYPIQGVLGRTVATSGTYNFPIGDPANAVNGPVTITTNGVTGTTLYSVNYTTTLYGFNKFTASGGLPVYALNASQWTVSPNAAATSGAITISLKATAYSNGVTDASRYLLLHDSSGYWVPVTGAAITETAGVITASGTLPAPTVTTVFIIGIKGASTQWTGATNSSWTNAGNWTNGVPSANLQAQFVTGSPLYPTGVTTANTAGTMTVASGVTLQLPQNFNVSQGITNDGIIEIIGSTTFSGLNAGNTPLSGSGRLLFTASSPGSFTSNYTLSNGLEVNRAAGLSAINLTIAGSLVLTNGVLTGNITMYNANATATSAATSYINGSLNRSVNASGTYLFPVGIAANPQIASLTLNNISGPQTITVSFTAASPGTVNTTASGVPVTSALNAGYWTITPNIGLSSGNYIVNLVEAGATNTVTDATRYVVIKRISSSFSWGFYGNNGAASQNGGVVTASASNINAFSDFAIGIANSTVGVLPLHFISFTAIREGGRNVKLRWTTSQEINTSHFEIQHSLDGNSWQNIASVAALQGTGTNNYSYLDNNLSKGMHYYRLRQIDNDGRFAYSVIASVKIEESSSAMIYPNPVQGNTVNVYLNASYSDKSTYSIIDSKGVVMSNGIILGTQATIDVQKLSSGSYWLKFSNGQTLSFIK